MAKIYISYRTTDKAAALALSSRLKALGHSIVIDVDTIAAGQDWRDTLTKGLRDSEVFVALLTEESQNSQWVVSEMGIALGYAQSNKQLLILPVIFGDVKIPAFVQHIQCVIARDRNIEEVASRIHEAASSFTGQLAAEAKQQEAARARIESNAAVFINDAVSILTAFERRNRMVGTLWYSLGFTALLSGLGVAFYSVSNSATVASTSWPVFAYVTLKSVLAIALLAASAKYGFGLGKSFTSESLKASDRLHAISFGKFYLQVYGATATWSEVKEAFQHWNIDRRSSFSDLDVAHIDPQVMAVLIEAAKSLSIIAKPDKASEVKNKA